MSEEFSFIPLYKRAKARFRTPQFQASYFVFLAMKEYNGKPWHDDYASIEAIMHWLYGIGEVPWFAKGCDVAMRELHEQWKEMFNADLDEEGAP